MGDTRRPHPFFWIFLLTVSIGVLFAALAGGASPSFALDSNAVYRAEIGLVVGGVLYMLAVGSWLAWQGRSFKRVDLPGGAGLETPSAALDETATDFADFEAQTEKRFEVLEAALKDLNERVETIERVS